MGFTRIYIFSIFTLVALAWSCDDHSAKSDLLTGRAVGLEWNKCLLDLDHYSSGYRPPVSARQFAYAGISAWEASLPAFTDAHTCTTNFKGLVLPKWNNQKTFVLPAALNSAYQTTAKCFFPNAPLPQKEQYNQLYSDIKTTLLQSFNPEDIDASAEYGKAVANAVYLWSATDSIGHMAHLFNYDRTYKPPVGPGLWAPSIHDPMPLPALLPHWGNARTFVINPDEIKVNPPIPFSTAHNSLFFAQALEIYSSTQPLTEENRWIAEFWSDDIEGVTYSTASRWISIANQAIALAKPDCETSLEIWLKIGLALNDGAVVTWKTKYKYNVERPEQYIRDNIRPDWEPLYYAQSFPSYPSGHAYFAGASANILSAVLGDHFEMTDYSHEGRKEFLGRPRAFHSFQEMATENALSRIYIGVHYRMDCEEGLRLGQLISSKVLALKVRG